MNLCTRCGQAGMLKHHLVAIISPAACPPGCRHGFELLDAALEAEAHCAV